MFANIKNLNKGPKKSKKYFEGKGRFTPKRRSKSFMAKSSDLILLKQNAPRKEHWRFFLVEIVAHLLLPKSPLGQVLYRTAINRIVEGDFITVKNRTIKTDITRNMVGNKTPTGSLVQKTSRIDSRRVSDKCSP